ncbi:lamin tail domain-containing protein [Streptomyces durbertensis]|uniref:lamin tail domain-containing protein n=1 Tax=Streptomyces durbertensis TaxID=2448886 RepID=UPI002B1F8B9F|nr:lamin tail domain-containing protein [Streptomyces durbertensis]
MSRTPIRLLPAAAVAALAAGLLAGPAAPAHAAGSVHLAKIYYDSPGKDDRSNTSLNGEWVRITNSTAKSVKLTGWTLTDAAGHRYTFKTFTLKAGKSVTVRTGKGTDTSGTVYQQRAAYVWNNDKDTATLRRADGSLRDTCSYNSTKVDYKNC